MTTTRPPLDLEHMKRQLAGIMAFYAAMYAKKETEAKSAEIGEAR